MGIEENKEAHAILIQTSDYLIQVIDVRLKEFEEKLKKFEERLVRAEGLGSWYEGKLRGLYEQRCLDDDIEPHEE